MLTSPSIVYRPRCVFCLLSVDLLAQTCRSLVSRLASSAAAFLVRPRELLWSFVTNYLPTWSTFHSWNRRVIWRCILSTWPFYDLSNFSRCVDVVEVFEACSHSERNLHLQSSTSLHVVVSSISSSFAIISHPLALPEFKRQLSQAQFIEFLQL